VLLFAGKLIVAKKELTLREHLSTIQSAGGKARWASLNSEQRSEQARKAVSARWAKNLTASAASTSTAIKGTFAKGRKPAPGKKLLSIKKDPKKK
jgi:hypothetical protein